MGVYTKANQNIMKMDNMDKQESAEEWHRNFHDDGEQPGDASRAGSASLIQPGSTTATKPRTKRRRSRSPHKDSSDENDASNPKRYRFDSPSNVNPPSALPHTLQLPHPTDPPSRFTAKLNATLASLSKGQSIASTTNFHATPNPNRDAVAKAEPEMHPNERMMWDDYLTNPALELPSIAV